MFQHWVQIMLQAFLVRFSNRMNQTHFKPLYSLHILGMKIKVHLKLLVMTKGIQIKIQSECMWMTACSWLQVHHQHFLIRVDFSLHCLLMRRSEYFPTFQCNKSVKLNLQIPLQKFKRDTSKLLLHIFRSQNMQEIQFEIVKCMHTHKHILIYIIWLEYFYSPPRAKAASLISKIIKQSVLET